MPVTQPSTRTTREDEDRGERPRRSTGHETRSDVSGGSGAGQT